MPDPGGTVSVTVGKLPCKIHVQSADGSTPVAFNDAAYASRLTLPVEEVGADKVIYLAANGTYTVTIWVNDVQIYSAASSVTGGGDVAINVPTESASS